MKILLLAFVCLLAACDKQTVELRTEHIDLQELDQKLRTSTEYKHLKNDIALELLDSRDGELTPSLLVSGSRDKIERIIQMAKMIDRPQSYYLEVANNKPGSISTSSKEMRILLHPNQQVALGHFTLQGGPWSSHLVGKNHLLKLTLDNNLVLSITIRNGDEGEVDYYSGKQPLRLDKWVEAFRLGGAKSNKIVVSTKKKELWLRLVKASQSR